MALNVVSQKKKPAPRKNPEGMLDGDLVRDAAPAVGVGFALSHLESQVEGFEWFRKMSSAKRLLALTVAAVYFRRKGNHPLAYALFALAGTYVPKYLAEKKIKEQMGAGVPQGAAPAGNTIPMKVDANGNTVNVKNITHEMTEATAMGAINYRAYGTFTEEPELPFNTNNLFAVG